MTRHDDFDRTLADWFETESAQALPADDLDRVIDATRRRRPRPAWLSGFGSDWVGEAPDAGSAFGVRSLGHTGMRWPTVLLLLLMVAAFVGGAIVVGARLSQPSPLPSGRLGHLAYGLDGDIYLADWDGANAVKVADGASGGPATCGSNWGEGPIWSADGRHFAYRSSSGERSASGDPCTGLVVITDAVNNSVASFPGVGWRISWSPDSTRVATWVDLGTTIGIYGFGGGRQALLTVPTDCPLPGDFDPVWSPDGNSLVIAGCVVPLDGGPPRRAPASDPASHFRAAYSPDLARIAYIDYPSSASLVIAKTDRTQVRVLAGATSGSNGYGPGPAYDSPVLSQTGDRVAFTWSPALYDQTSDQSLSVAELRVVDVASGTVTTLARVTGNPSLRPIRFSPEGDRILFSSGHDNGVTTLWSIGVDGSGARLLVQGTDWGDWQKQPTSTSSAASPTATP